MHKRAFQGLKHKFMHDQFFLKYSLRKKSLSYKLKFEEIWLEKTGDLQVRPFQGLKLTLMHESDLLTSVFEKKNYETDFIFVKIFLGNTHMHEHAF